MLQNDETDDPGTLVRQCFADAEPTHEFVNRLHERLIGELADSKPLAARPLPVNRPRPEVAGVWNRIAHYTARPVGRNQRVK